MMKGIVKLMIACFLLLAVATAQRAGGMAGGRPGTPPPGGNGPPPAGARYASPPFAGVRVSHEGGSHGWNQPFLGAVYPAFWGPAVGGLWQAQSSPGAIIVMMQPVAQATPDPPPAPSEPVQAQMRENSWPKSGADSAPAFAIVPKDGTVKRAVTTCRQGSVLTYMAIDGASGRVEISTIDRDTTGAREFERSSRMTSPAALRHRT